MNGKSEVFLRAVMLLYELRGKVLRLALPGDDGLVRLQALGVKLGAAPGPKLTLAWPGGSASL